MTSKKIPLPTPTDAPVSQTPECNAEQREQLLLDILAEFGSSAAQQDTAGQSANAQTAPEELPADKEAAVPEPVRAATAVPVSLKIGDTDFSEFLEEQPAGEQHSAQPQSEAEAPTTVRTRVGAGELVLRLTAFLVVVITVMFLYSQTLQNRRSSAAIETVTQAVLQQLDLSEMQEADNQMIRRLYGIDPADVGDCVLYYPTTNMGARELLIVRLDDPSLQQSIADAAQSRKQTQMNSFEGYGIEQYALLGDSIIQVQGNYILFVVHENADAACQAFLSAL